MLGTYTPTPLRKVHYGPNTLADQLLPSIRYLLAQAQGGDVDERTVTGKVMIVTGRSLMEKTPVIKDVEKVLKKNGFYGLTFSDIAQHARMSTSIPHAPPSISLISYLCTHSNRFRLQLRCDSDQGHSTSQTTRPG